MMSRFTLINGLQEGKTPLHVAISNNQLELVQLLLNHQADINIRDKVSESNQIYI